MRPKLPKGSPNQPSPIYVHLDIFPNLPTQKMVKVSINPSNGPGAFSTLLRLDATFENPPHVHQSATLRFWGPNWLNLSLMVSRPKPPNVHIWYRGPTGKPSCIPHRLLTLSYLCQGWCLHRPSWLDQHHLHHPSVDACPTYGKYHETILCLLDLGDDISIAIVSSCAWCQLPMVSSWTHWFFGLSLLVHFHHSWSTAHVLLMWSSLSLVNHLNAPNTYNTTRHLLLAISLVKHRYEIWFN